MKKRILTKKAVVASIVGVTLFTGSALFANPNMMMDHSKMNVTECTKMHKVMHNESHDVSSSSSLNERWKAFDELSAKMYPVGNDGGNN